MKIRNINRTKLSQLNQNTKLTRPISLSRIRKKLKQSMRFTKIELMNLHVYYLSSIKLSKFSMSILHNHPICSAASPLLPVLAFVLRIDSPLFTAIFNNKFKYSSLARIVAKFKNFGGTSIFFIVFYARTFIAIIDFTRAYFSVSFMGQSLIMPSSTTIDG